MKQIKKKNYWIFTDDSMFMLIDMLHNIQENAFQQMFKSFDISLTDPEEILFVFFNVFYREFFQNRISCTRTNIFIDDFPELVLYSGS